MTVSDRTDNQSKRWNKAGPLLVFLVMIFHLFLGCFQLGKAAITDEHYWIYERIPGFWKNIGEKDWGNTRRSDKPGTTLMWLGGFGLLKYDNPIEKEKNVPTELEALNSSFRLPVLIFSVLSIPFFYLLLGQLLGRRIAALGVIFLGLSPIILGVVRIVNPDALLWIFSTLAILAYFSYLKSFHRRNLVLAGLFLGLALLTKYVSNILLVFFLGVSLLEFILASEEMDEGEKRVFFRKLIFSYLSVVAVALLVFFVFYPAVWVKPERLLLGTLFSEAFLPVWKWYVGILIFFLLDLGAAKGRMSVWTLSFISRKKKWLARSVGVTFLFFVAAAFINVIFTSRWVDFSAILASPKSSFQEVGLFSQLAANFYPIIFGVSPLVILAVIFVAAQLVGKKNPFAQWKTRVAFYFLVFILLYYLAAVFSQVVSIIRYQIMIFPLVLFLGAIGLDALITALEKRIRFFPVLVLVAAMICSLWALQATRPFYLAYSSVFLPQKYFLDQKDMGYGSYEAAMLLNSLPEAEKKMVWSDNNGVCSFFVGGCSASLVLKEIKPINFDYYVVSAGRRSKVGRAVDLRVRTNSPNTVRLDQLYLVENPLWQLAVAGRKNNFVKIIDAKTINIK